MTLETEPGIVAVHADPVVAHAHQPATALLEIDIHRRRARVEGILHQLLHHGRRALDDFS